MVAARCAAIASNGRPCRAWPVKETAFCFWHDPGSEDEAADARRLGGLRRRREKTVAGAYDFEGLNSVEAIRRLLEIAMLDVLGLDNSIARARVLITGASVAAKLLETGELQDRIEQLETIVKGNRPDPDNLGPDLLDAA